MDKKYFIPSVNFHLWEPCNMQCKFCFASFEDVKKTILPKGHLEKHESIKVVNLLADFGFKKITFVGGEPTLCPWLTELIEAAKSKGMTTMIVTNGSRLNKDFLIKNQSVLDWITLSIDSLYFETNSKIGRISNGLKTEWQYYDHLVTMIHEYGYRLKINTVVNSKNYTEDLNSFIKKAQPERWKILQVLPIKGQNDKAVNDFVVSQNQYLEFVNRHSKHKFSVFESNEKMNNSYVMVDPAGRFFDNKKGYHTYSSPILDTNVKEAFNVMDYNFSKFKNRGGLYNWD